MVSAKDHQAKQGKSLPNRFFMDGLRVLVVDDDPTCLIVVKEMLLQCNYEVTTCEQARVALSMLRERKGRFDLVLTDVHMPDIDGFKLLELIGLELDLPVIMMSADTETKVAVKGLEHGACYYLMKPICFEELKNIWQHVVRKKRAELKGNEQPSSIEDTEGNKASDEVHEEEAEVECASSVNEGNYKQQKRKKEEIQEREDDGEEEDNDDSAAQKKPRVVWHQALHNEFLKAVDQLSFEKAVPKKILEIMSVPGLTRENVASHLQKYRLFLRRLNASPSQSNLSFNFSSGSLKSLRPVSPHSFVDMQDQVGHHQFMDRYSQSGFTGHMTSSTGQVQFLNQGAQNNNPMMGRLGYGPSIIGQGNLQQVLPGGSHFDPKQPLLLLQKDGGNPGGLGLGPYQMRMGAPASAIETMQIINQPQPAPPGGLLSSSQHNNLIPNIQGRTDLSGIGNPGLFGVPRPSYSFNNNYSGLCMTGTGGLYGLTHTGPIMAASNNNPTDVSNKGKAVIEYDPKEVPNSEISRSTFGSSNQEWVSFGGLPNTNQSSRRFTGLIQQQNDLPTGGCLLSEVPRNPMFGSSSISPQFDEARIDDMVFKQKPEELMDADFDISSFQLDDDRVD